MKTTLLLATAALLAQPATAAPITLTPSSQWVVQSNDETCRVLRRFGSSDPVLLSFEQGAPRVPMSMMATGGALHVPALRNRSAVTADFAPLPLAHFVADGSAEAGDGHDLLIWRSVHFRPSGKVAGGSQSRRRGSAGKLVPLDTQAQQRAEAFARERGVEALDIQMGKKGDAVRLATGPMNLPMGLLRSCMDRQLKTWGLDPAVERTIVSPPVAQTRPDTWVQFAGATKLSLKRDELSPVTVRVLVNEFGKVTGCKAAAPRDGAAFEEALCRNVAENAVLIPARTAEGKTVPSYLIATIRRSGGR